MCCGWLGSTNTSKTTSREYYSFIDSNYVKINNIDETSYSFNGIYDGYDYVLYQYILASRIKDPNCLCGIIPFNILHKVYLEEYEN